MQLNVFGHHTISYTKTFCDTNTLMICIRPSLGFTRPKQGFFMRQKARSLPVYGDESLKNPILLLTSNEKYSNTVNSIYMFILCNLTILLCVSNILMPVIQKKM